MDVHAVLRVTSAFVFLHQAVPGEVCQGALDAGPAAQPLEVGVADEHAAPAPEHRQQRASEVHVKVLGLTRGGFSQVVELLAQAGAFHHRERALFRHPAQDGREGGLVQQQVRVQPVVSHGFRAVGQIRAHPVLQGTQRFRFTSGQHEAPAVAAVALDQPFLTQILGDGRQRVVSRAADPVDLLPQLGEGEGWVVGVVQYCQDRLAVCGAAVLSGGSHAAYRRKGPVESWLTLVETLWSHVTGV
ncbi:hypothetical protein [Deinococcus aluminii]|uniref:hypothetical protein n=1 Tax=Deinococcus aluminii TaxID=1656885 RepID=UPI0031E86170